MNIPWLSSFYTWGNVGTDVKYLDHQYTADKEVVSIKTNPGSLRYPLYLLIWVCMCVHLAFLHIITSSLKMIPCYFWLLNDSHCHVPLGEKDSFSWCVYFSAEEKMTGLMSPEEWTQRRLFTLGSPTQQLWRVRGWRAGSYYLNGGMRQGSPATNSQVDLLQWDCLIND